jgi:hypothetical protein
VKASSGTAGMLVLKCSDLTRSPLFKKLKIVLVERESHCRSGTASKKISSARTDYVLKPRCLLLLLPLISR